MKKIEINVDTSSFDNKHMSEIDKLFKINKDYIVKMHREQKKIQRRFRKYMKSPDYVYYVTDGECRRHKIDESLLNLIISEFDENGLNIKFKEIIVNLWEQRKLKRIMRNDRQNNKRRL